MDQFVVVLASVVGVSLISFVGVFFVGLRSLRVGLFILRRQI
jgi:hypothetical protein